MAVGDGEMPGAVLAARVVVRPVGTAHVTDNRRHLVLTPAFTYACSPLQHGLECVVTYLFHDHSPDGDRHPSTLSCKLLAVTRETKLTLSIEQRAPAIFGRAAITLGIGPHSS